MVAIRGEVGVGGLVSDLGLGATGEQAVGLDGEGVVGEPGVDRREGGQLLPQVLGPGDAEVGDFGNQLARRRIDDRKCLPTSHPFPGKKSAGLQEAWVTQINRHGQGPSISGTINGEGILFRDGPRIVHQKSGLVHRIRGETRQEVFGDVHGAKSLLQFAGA